MSGFEGREGDGWCEEDVIPLVKGAHGDPDLGGHIAGMQILNCGVPLALVPHATEPRIDGVAATGHRIEQCCRSASPHHLESFQRVRESGVLRRYMQPGAIDLSNNVVHYLSDFRIHGREPQVARISDM